MNRTRAFLLFAAIGLTPVALSYGAMPEVSLAWLFGIDAGDVNSSHIFRAVMGLYLGMIVFWVVGAIDSRLRLAALWSLAVFMLGLAGGRILSLVLDGFPHPLLFTYLVLEVVIGTVGLILIRRHGTGESPD